MSPMRRIPFGPPPPFTTPYRCRECGEINWLLPKEKVSEVSCLRCGRVGQFEKEPILDHIFPEVE